MTANLHVIRLEVPENVINRIYETLPPCEIKESPGKGKGVFAKETGKKHDYVTAYPIHVLMQADKIAPGGMAEYQLLSKFPDVEEGINRERLKWLLNVYSFDIRFKNLVAVGDPAILKPKNLGHMINDRVKCSGARGEQVYETVSLLGQNVVPETLMCNGKPYIFMKATRDIEAGEELFFSYGVTYWRPTYAGAC
jgi:hypothetical protein